MNEDDRKKIDEILELLECKKGFVCAETGFANLCRARDFGDDFFLECLEQTNPPCPFALVYDYGATTHFCRCPLRVYLAKKFGK